MNVNLPSLPHAVGVTHPRFSVLVIVFFMLLVLGLLAVTIEQEHRYAIDRALREATKLTQLVAFEFNDLFSDTDEVLQALVRLVPEQSQDRIGETSVNEWLRAFTDSITGVEALNLFDADGGLRHSSIDGLEAVTIADRDHFRALREHQDQQTSFSEILTARTTGNPALFLLRALRDTQSQFLGAVAAVINPQRFDTLRQVGIAPTGVALLCRSDMMTLVARYPPSDEVELNRPLSLDHPISQRVLVGERSGTLRYTVEGERWLGSFQVLQDYPFYVQVTFSEAYVLASWWRYMEQMSGLAALLILGGGLSVRHGWQAQQAQQAALKALQESEHDLKQTLRLLQAALESSPYGTLIVDAPEGRIRFANRAARAILHANTGSNLPVIDRNFFAQYAAYWQIQHADGTSVSLEQLPLNRAIIHGEEIQDEELSIIRAGGTEADQHWFSVSAAPIRDDNGVITAGISVGADITLLKRAQDRLQRSAHYDALTGLPNRILLADRLEQAIARAQRHSHCLAVVFIDLDHFKPVNDQHGHAMGDALLIAIAERMQQNLRHVDTLARLGGDEFVAVLSDLGEYSDAWPLVQRLLDACATPLNVGGVSLCVSASIGVALYSQDNVLSIDQLLRQADQAMYHAKMQGKNCWYCCELNTDTPC